MPQLDLHFFTPLFFWTLVSFGIFFFLLYRYALPPLLQVMDEREKKIRDNIGDAERGRPGS